MNQASIPGIKVPQLLIPGKGIDLQKWAVIACDQFTAQPEYWEQVQSLVGSSPSTFNMILPEVFLGSPDETERIRRINKSMHDALDRKILVAHDGPIYIERTFHGKTRQGIDALPRFGKI